MDLVKAFESVADFNHAVRQNSDPGELMSRAMRHALIKRDVVHLTFPDEVACNKKPEKSKAQTPENRITPFNISPPSEMMDKAVRGSGDMCGGYGSPMFFRCFPIFFRHFFQVVVHGDGRHF